MCEEKEKTKKEILNWFTKLPIDRQSEYMDQYDFIKYRNVLEYITEIYLEYNK